MEVWQSYMHGYCVLKNSFSVRFSRCHSNSAETDIQTEGQSNQNRFKKWSSKSDRNAVNLWSDWSREGLCLATMRQPVLVKSWFHEIILFSELKWGFPASSSYKPAKTERTWRMILESWRRSGSDTISFWNISRKQFIYLVVLSGLKCIGVCSNWSWKIYCSAPPFFLSCFCWNRKKNGLLAMAL